MTRKVQDLHNQILQLPNKERLLLIEQLISDLDGEEDTGVEELWLHEAEERYRAYRKGDLSSKPAERVINDARSSLR